MTLYAGEVIDGVELGEWLEDDGLLSRYGVGKEESVWVCTECEHLADQCMCESYYDEPDVDEAQEWSDFDPDC